jgi:transcriptional regulator of acetoin/glycerol metabolism
MIFRTYRGQEMPPEPDPNSRARRTNMTQPAAPPTAPSVVAPTPLKLRAIEDVAAVLAASPSMGIATAKLRAILRAIRDAMVVTGGNKRAAAKLLGISRSTLYRLLQQARRC